MADVSGFDPNTPSGTSKILDGDDKIRSIQSDLKAVWEEEHFFQDGSAASGGDHKLGSARPSYVSRSNVSLQGDNGRLVLDSESGTLWDASADLNQPIPSSAIVPSELVEPGAGSTITSDNRKFILEHTGTDVGNTQGLSMIYQNILMAQATFDRSQITQDLGGSVKTLGGLAVDTTVSGSTTTYGLVGSWTDGSEITAGNLIQADVMIYGLVAASDLS